MIFQAQPAMRGSSLRRAFLALFLVGMLGALLCGVAQASDRGPALFDTNHVSWLRDPGGSLTIERLASRRADFKPLADGRLSRGYTRDVYWLRLVLPVGVDTGGEYWLEVLPLVLDDVRLYEALPDGAWRERRSGDTVPYNAHEGGYRSASFRLEQPRAGQVLYVRVKTTSSMAIAPRLWQASALRTASDEENFGAGLFVGGMLVAALFNAVGWLTVRRGIYGLFALFVMATLLRWCAVDGLVAQYLFPNDVTIPELITNALLGAVVVTVALCEIRFLQLREHFPWLLRYYQLIGIGLGTLTMASPWIGHYGDFATLLFFSSLVTPVITMPAYIRLWRTGGLPGRLITAALLLSYFVMMPSNLSTLGLVSYHPITWQLVRLSDLPMVLMLHASIVLQAREAERARNRAQRQASSAQEASDRERRAREEQGQFLAMITHEVRTPVAVIDAATHSLRLLDDLGADPTLRTNRYHSIKQAVGRMKTLMELAEMHGRLEPGERKLDAAPFDMEVLNEEALSALDPREAPRVVVNAADALPRLKGDVRLLFFALLNVLDNAVKYAAPGTPIHVDIDAAANGVTWRVRDSGRGVPLGMEEVIFEKYHRLDETSDQPGLGLGLALARQIAEQHGGRLTLDPAWRDGACFELWLPEAA